MDDFLCEWRCAEEYEDEGEIYNDDDGCTEFMLNWRSNLQNPRPICEDQNGKTTIFS